MRTLLFWLLLSCAPALPASPLTDSYLAAYFAQFPTRATAAGVYRYDAALDDLSAKQRARWIATQRDFRVRIEAALAENPGDPERIDLEILGREIDLGLIDWTVMQRPTRDPLFWIEPLAQATLYLALREDRPASERLALALKRTQRIPGLVAQALDALSDAAPEDVVALAAEEAQKRLTSLAGFYRDGLPQARGIDKRMQARLRSSGERAAKSIEKLAARCAELATIGTADFRLGTQYAERFRLGTAIDTPIAEVLATAHRELTEKREEAAAFGRGVWALYYPKEAVPFDDRLLLRRLFTNIESQRPASTAELVAQYTAAADAAFAFAAEHAIVTIPEPRSLMIGTAPAWLGGQSVGGVFAPGPFAADAQTLFLLPNIANSAPQADKDRFFSAFNNGFNRMIVAHELVPGHYVQLKTAAHQAHPVRSVFGDGVYTEGWGSFSERLMLDHGWGGLPERLAHYKKQMENIARLIADISVHTEHWEQGELTAFATDEALMDAQFAANLWRRTLFSSPQLTTYHLGYRDLSALWLDWLARHQSHRPTREFVDAMLSLGAVPVREYARVMR